MSIAPLASRRLALVVGNDTYTHLPPLKNAVNDARGVAAALTALGFTTQLALDVTVKTMRIAIDKFRETLRPGDVAVVYFAGHGIQIRAVNFLLPVDFNAANEIDAEYEAYPARKLLDSMTSTDAALTVLILDACRNNPLAGSRSGGGGLAQMDSGRGSLIAFAAEPGKTAADGSASENGVFTRHLLRTLRQPGLTVQAVFDRVRQEVYEETGGRQVPMTMSGVTGTFYFNPPDSSTGTAPLGGSPEDELWSAIATSDSADMFAAYLRRYPEGKYTRPAEERLRALGGPRAARGSPPAFTHAPGLVFPAEARDDDDRTVRDLLKEYIDAFGARDTTRVKRIWPLAPRVQLDALFGNVRRIETTLDCGAVKITDARAEVTCVQRQVTESRRGEIPPAVPVSQTFDLVKVKDTWRIDRLR